MAKSSGTLPSGAALKMIVCPSAPKRALVIHIGSEVIFSKLSAAAGGTELREDDLRPDVDHQRALRRRWTDDHLQRGPRRQCPRALRHPARRDGAAGARPEGHS